jgi:hypothetical protein
VITVNDVHEEIERVAYELYVLNGKKGGNDLDYWLEAERLVKACYQNQQGAKFRDIPGGSEKQQKTGKVQSKSARR